MNRNAAINETTTTIPEDLCQCPQWVCWQPRRRPDGRLAKVPVQPDGTCASVTDPRTWSDFEACIHTGCGVGFVLTPQTLLGKSKTGGTSLTHHDSSPESDACKGHARRVCYGRRGGEAAILQLRCLPGLHTSP
jgi:hypothetical protein